VLLLLLLLLLQSVVRSDEEWKQVLSPGQYFILRQAGTELPRSRWGWNWSGQLLRCFHHSTCVLHRLQSYRDVVVYERSELPRSRWGEA
jgi:hypothetical protein